jgi:hypothetical protein
MAKVAQVKIKFSADGIDGVERGLDELERKGKALFSRLPKEVQKEFNSAGEAIQSSLKSAILGAVNDMGQAIAGPAKSTFAGVIQAAYVYRREVSGIAVATGKDFAAVSGKVDAVSMRIGEMPARTMGWAREVRRMTGDWNSAVDSIGEFKNVALALDQPLEATVATAQRLGGSFGIKSQDQVRQFFGLLNAQANETGNTFGRVYGQFNAFSGAFARMAGRGAGTFAGISSAFAASSQDPEQAQRNQGFGMGLLNQGVRLVEMRMRNKGLLGKGEFITDSETGEVDPQKYLRAMQFMQKDMLRFYGSKKRAIEVQAGEDLESRRTVGGFLNTDLSKVKSLSDLKPEELKALEKMSGMAAGKRDQADVAKLVKDKDLGMTLIGAQDAAVGAGGGAAGIALSQAAGVFSTAVDKFGGVVAGIAGQSFMGSAAGGLVAGAGRGAAGLLGTAASGLSKIPGIGMAIAGGLGIAKGVDWATGKVTGKSLGQHGETLGDMMGGAAMNGLDENGKPNTLWSKLTYGLIGAPAISQGRSGGPVDTRMSSADHRAIGNETAKATASQVLKVQIVPSVSAPEGESAGS